VTAEPARRTIVELTEGWKTLRNSWTLQTSAGGVVIVVMALGPIGLTSLQTVNLAQGMCLIIAATGLCLVVGFARLPVLSQGAFMAIGAVTTMLCITRWEWDPIPAVLAGIFFSLVIGLGLGRLVCPLPPAYVAACTWLFAWLTWTSLEVFPGLSGGASGVVLPPERAWGIGLTPTILYEAGLVAVVVAIGICAATAHSTTGLKLSAIGHSWSAAINSGIDPRKALVAAFSASAALGGLAGGLLVLTNGVSDPGAYNPFLSFTLLAVLVIGGTRSSLGAAIGSVSLGILALLAHALAKVEGVDSSQFDPMLVAILVVAVISLGGQGITAVPWRRRTAQAPLPSGGMSWTPAHSDATVECRNLTKRFGSIVAAESVTFSMASGEIVALIGPNGSGKTTILRMIAGVLAPDQGTVTASSELVDWRRPWKSVHRGVSRTLQRTAVYDRMSVLDNVLVGGAFRRTNSGAIRTLFATPKSRTESAEARADAQAILREVGMSGTLDTLAGSLTHSEKRLVMIASALAARPHTLLIDEAVSLLGSAEARRISVLLKRYAEAGLAILVVDHNVQFVRTIASRVLVLDEGRIIASGSAESVMGMEQVNAAYLGGLLG
jgi:ABC-type branched-subunit amino acid transport system ATPase component/ABC-type branched-subunit amino acid transport system permease subunit